LKRILVCLKQAVDVSQLKVDPATRQLITSGAPKKMSDFDKNALEEAIRIKEKNPGVEVFTLTVSPDDVKAVLREGLAIGADKAYCVVDAAVQNADTFGISYILAEMAKKIGEFDLILCGDSSLDSFSGIVGSRMAELMNLPQMTSVRKINVEGDTVIAERSLEDAVETVKAKMPALLCVTREINQPRIPSLMMIMKASKKEVVQQSLTGLNVSSEKISPRIEVLEALAPKMERKKIKITGESVQEIAEKLAKTLVQEGVIGR
jgi:electron transfer flavoprotein beta subunit